MGFLNECKGKSLGGKNKQTNKILKAKCCFLCGSEEAVTVQEHRGPSTPQMQQPGICSYS